MQPARFRQADFLLAEIINTKVHESSREFGGGARAPFPDHGWKSSLLEVMNFMFLWKEKYLIRLLHLLVRYCFCHSNIKIHIFLPPCNILCLRY